MRQFILSPRKKVLSTPKIEFNKVSVEQEQRIKNYLYKKSNILGRGYSSKVYKGYKSQQTHKPYAIKVIDLSNLTLQQRRNLQNELKIQKTLSHPNIVKCYESFKTPTTFYLVLEYCHYGTLSQYLKNHNKLDQSTVINIIGQIADSYSYLIDKKILHRDIKPQNILRKDNVWKLTDFGFCYHLQDETYVDDLNVGTPLYMPFQSLTKNIYSHKSDIYSIGMITYKLLTGTTPWRCNTQKQLIHLMIAKKIVFPEVRNKYLLQFLIKSLELEMNKRLGPEEFTQLFQKMKQEQNEYQRQSCLGSDIRKYDSTRSISTAQSTSQQKISSIFPQQNSSNSSINSKTQINSSQKMQFIENSIIISSQLDICRLIHHILLNIDSFIVSDNIQNPESGTQANCNIKQVLITFFYKYVLKTLKLLNNFFSTQLNQSQQKKLKYFGLKNLTDYKKSRQFMSTSKILKQRLHYYDAQFLESYFKKSIVTIRFINKKFPQLGQNNLSLGSQFYKRFLGFIKPYIQNLSEQIQSNLEKAKMRQTKIKKDKILALSFFLRLFTQFHKKSIIMQGVEQKNQNQDKENQQIKVIQNDIQNQLNKLQQLKQSIKIEYLYNFSETSLQFKEFHQINKKLPSLLAISV